MHKSEYSGGYCSPSRTNGKTVIELSVQIGSSESFRQRTEGISQSAFSFGVENSIHSIIFIEYLLCSSSVLDANSHQIR
jgi:hypothetical protein